MILLTGHTTQYNECTLFLKKEPWSTYSLWMEQNLNMCACQHWEKCSV